MYIYNFITTIKVIKVLIFDETKDSVYIDTH